MRNVLYLQEIFLAIMMILSLANPGMSSTSSFDVMKYGAVGDGKTNDSPVISLFNY